MKCDECLMVMAGKVDNLRFLNKLKFNGPIRGLTKKKRFSNSPASFSNLMHIFVLHLSFYFFFCKPLLDSQQFSKLIPYFNLLPYLEYSALFQTLLPGA